MKNKFSLASFVLRGAETSENEKSRAIIFHLWFNNYTTNELIRT